MVCFRKSGPRPASGKSQVSAGISISSQGVIKVGEEFIELVLAARIDRVSAALRRLPDRGRQGHLSLRPESSISKGIQARLRKTGVKPRAIINDQPPRAGHDAGVTRH